MARSATLNVQVLVDAAKAATGLNQTVSQFESFGKKLSNAVVGAIAVKGVTDLAKTVISAASGLEQAIGGTDKVFGDSADAIHSWAKDSTDSIRLPQKAVEQFATLIKTQLDATGEPMSKIVENTKKLVQVGADLSAVTGQDLSSSIAAVKSALAGEYDPIQNLGVAMTAATVNAKALEIAHGDLALASSTAVQQQARVAEIMDKSAFATGAAAEESESFQARVDSLKEQAGNLAAAVGGPLLDSLGQLVEGLSDGTGAATTIGTGLGTMLGVALKLPTPILAVAAGLAGLIIVSAKWGSATIAALSTVGTGFRNATTSAAGFKAAMAGVAAPLAGGALLLGVGALIAAIASTIGRVTHATEAGTDSLKDYTAALVESGNVSTDATSKAFESALLNSEAFAAMTADGLGAADAIRILTGTQETWQGMINNNDESIGGLSGSTKELVNGFIDANGQAGKLAQAQIDGAKAMEESKSATDADTLAKQANAKAAADVAAVQADLADAYGRLGANLAEAAKSTELSAALDATKTAAEEAGRAMDYVNQQIDQFTGRSASLDDATVDWNSKLRIDKDTTSSVAEYVKTVGDAPAVLNDFNTATLGQTKAGEDAYKQLRDLKGGYDDLNAAAYEAALKTGGTEAAFAALATTSATSRSQFIEFLKPLADAGVNVEALADKMGILNLTELTPKFMEVISKDEDAQAALRSFQAAKIDPKTVQLTADDQATPAVESAITYVDQLTGQQHVIPLAADPTDANAVLAAILADIAAQHPELGINADPAAAQGELTGLLGAINGAEGTATIAANPSPADAALAQTTRAINGTTATLGIAGNPSSANATVDQTTGGVQQNSGAVLRIIANSAPARQAVEAFISDTNARTASVTVTANTAPFYAAYNALPTSRDVTVTTRNVTIAAPPAAPVLRTSFAAPTLSRSGVAAGGSTASSASGVTYNVTVQGHLHDPDGLARALERVQTARARRSTTVIAR